MKTNGFVAVMTMLLLVCGASSQANLLSNGNFNVPASGAAPTGWTVWSWGTGWSNHENTVGKTYDSTYYQVCGGMNLDTGGGGVFQTVPGVGGVEYTLTVLSSADAWWLPYGEMRMIFLDSSSTEIGSAMAGTVDPAVYGQNYDIAHPWASYSLVATTPVGTTQIKVEFAEPRGTGSVLFDNADLVLNTSPLRAHDPNPVVGETGVLIDTTLSWAVARDPNHLDQVDPNLASMKVYLGTDPNSLTLPLIATVTSWDSGTLRASCTPSSPLSRDTTYFWRVDSITDTAETRTGYVWAFDSQKSTPQITGQPTYQIVNAGATANFTVTVFSISPETYQWYKVNSPTDITLSNGGDISGADASTLSIANAEVADEGRYYCIVNNQSGIPTTSNQAPLGVKRKIAYWDFESGNANSTVAGSPASTLVGDPAFVAAAGVAGDAMEFDADLGAEDMLHTDPDPNATYFDICNINMTVGCWIKSTSIVDWNPLVSRDGETNGWQLRQSGDLSPSGTSDRPCFTTRGTTGSINGTPANRSVYDGNWHYVAATYDGAIKKVYIDGILSRIFDGDVEIEGNAVTGFIAATTSPVAIAGRMRAGVAEAFVAGTYDEVEIYNYALDATAIAQIYANIKGVAVCPDPSVPAADLDGDCIVNLNDFKLFASDWLEDTSVQPAP